MTTEEPDPASETRAAKKKPDVRVYLEEKVFPILTSGLEELLRAVEDREKKLKESEEEDIPEVQPLLFLARYLMRNGLPNSRRTSSRSTRGTAKAEPGQKGCGPPTDAAADGAEPAAPPE
jgi:hypothetical protein